MRKLVNGSPEDIDREKPVRLPHLKDPRELIWDDA